MWINFALGQKNGRRTWNNGASFGLASFFELTVFGTSAKIPAWDKLNDRHARNAGHR
jgi:hypothetical protein